MFIIRMKNCQTRAADEIFNIGFFRHKPVESVEQVFLDVRIFHELEEFSNDFSY